MTRRIFTVAAVLGLLVALPSAAQAAQGYDVQLLPNTPTGPGYAYRIMPNGEVVGATGPTGNTPAFAWSASKGMRAFTYTDPNTREEAPLLGQPIGISSDGKRIAMLVRDWVWEDGTLVQLPKVDDGAFAHPIIRMMNSAGQVAGEGTASWSALNAISWDGGDTIVLGDMEAVSGATAISSSGIVVGWQHDVSNNPIPVRFEGDSAIELGLPEGQLNGRPLDVNDAGDIVGTVSNGSTSFGWAYLGGEHHVFEEISCVRAINAEGQMLGQLGLGCSLALDQPAYLSTDSGQSWTNVAEFLVGEDPLSESDQIQGIGIDDLGRIALNVNPLNSDPVVALLLPEANLDVALGVDAPSAVQGGPSFDYDATVENLDVRNIDSYELDVTFTGDARLSEGVVPAACTTTKDEDQWVSAIACAYGELTSMSDELHRFSMVPSQNGTVTADFQLTAHAGDDIVIVNQEVQTVVSDDSADLSIDVAGALFEERTTVSMRIHNAGPDAADLPRLEATVPGNVFESAINEALHEDCWLDDEGAVLRCAFTSLEPDEAIVVDVGVFTDDDTFDLVIDVESDTPDPDLGNNHYSNTLKADPVKGCEGCSSTGGGGGPTTLAMLGLLLAWRRRRHPATSSPRSQG